MKPSVYGLAGAILAIIGLYLVARANNADDGNLSGIGFAITLIGSIGIITAIMASQRHRT